MDCARPLSSRGNMRSGIRYYSSAWIGIDGHGGTQDILQCGTEHEVVCVNGNTKRQVYAWMQWSPGPEVEITNFPVYSGDSMYCLVCVDSNTDAYIYLTNLNTSNYTSFGITAPSGTTLRGNSAEWILEAPYINGAQSNLANYGEIFFDEAIAGNALHQLIQAGSGTAIYMTDGSGNNLSVANIKAQQLIKLTFQ